MEGMAGDRGEIEHGPRESAVDAECVVCERKTLTCEVRCSCVLISGATKLSRGCVPDELAGGRVTVVETGTVEHRSGEGAVDGGVALDDEISGRGEEILGMDSCP